MAALLRESKAVASPAGYLGGVVRYNSRGISGMLSA